MSEVTVISASAPGTLDLARELDRALPTVVDLLVYTPEEFAAGEADPFGVFDLFRRDGIEILPEPDDG